MSCEEPSGDSLIQALTSELFFSPEGHWVQFPLSGQGTAKRHLSGVRISGIHFKRRKFHQTDNQWF